MNNTKTTLEGIIISVTLGLLVSGLTFLVMLSIGLFK